MSVSLRKAVGGLKANKKASFTSFLKLSWRNKTFKFPSSHVFISLKSKGNTKLLAISCCFISFYSWLNSRTFWRTIGVRRHFSRLCLGNIRFEVDCIYLFWGLPHLLYTSACILSLLTLFYFVLLHFALPNFITFCVKRYYILALRSLLHFVSKVIIFCVTFTFCVKSRYILRYYYILCELLHFVA